MRLVNAPAAQIIVSQTQVNLLTFLYFSASITATFGLVKDGMRLERVLWKLEKIIGNVVTMFCELPN
jgi:hypothetical protein